MSQETQRIAIVTGAGKAFSTGGDLSEFGSAPSPTIARWVRFRRDVWGRLRALPIPTVAALHGFTVGGGLEMALLCDVAIAAEDTRISLPETGAGMIPVWPARKPRRADWVSVARWIFV